MLTAVILAGGRGKRMGGNTPKQFLELGGRPLLWWSAARFASWSRVDAVVLVARSGTEELVGKVASAALGRTALSWSVVRGGARRQDSVLAGVAEARRKDPGGYVFIHDGVRPFFSLRLLETMASKLDAGAGGVVPVFPQHATLKEVAAGKVVRTVDRSRVLGAQTPQAFRTDVWWKAMEQVERRGLEVTDDAAVLEAAGIEVDTVDGEEWNLKVTRPFDLEVAELWLRVEPALELAGSDGAGRGR